MYIFIAKNASVTILFHLLLNQLISSLGKDGRKIEIIFMNCILVHLLLNKSLPISDPKYFANGKLLHSKSMFSSLLHVKMF